MKNWLIVLLALTTSLECKEIILNPPQKQETERIFNERENFPLTSHHRLTPKVNIITGEYLEEECDIVVAGSEPLSMRRFYGHFCPYHPGYASWRLNPEHFCAANLEWKEQGYFVSIGEENGNVISYDNRHDSGDFTFKADRFGYFADADAHGKSHPLNTKITYHKEDVNRESFRFAGEIIQGDGSKKIFKSPIHSWLSKMRLYENPRYKEGPYSITPNVWTPFQLPIIEERKANGNIIEYQYVDLKLKKEYPGYHLLSRITAYNSNKTKVLGWIKFTYKTICQGTEIVGIVVEGSDGRTADLEYDYTDVFEGGQYIRYLARVACPDKPKVTYHSDKTKKMINKEGKRITAVERPDGRLFSTSFHKDTWKVTAQHAPVGQAGEMLPIGKYIYHNNATEIIDAEGNKKIYHYDGEHRITKIEVYDGSKLYTTETFHWDHKTGNLLSKAFADLKTEYKYDKNQNVIEEKQSRGNESYTVYRSFSDDGFNLKLCEWDDFGKKVCYKYVKGTNLVSAEFVCEGNQIKKRTFYFYDDAAICVKKVLDDGVSENPENLLNVTYRRIKVIKPRYEYPCFGLPEEIEEKTINDKGEEVSLAKVAYTYAPSGKIVKEEHFDSKGKHRFTLKNVFDAQERLVASHDALGHKTSFFYDSNYNKIAEIGPLNVKREWIYDKCDRPVKMLEEGKCVFQKKYDKLGQVIAETDDCGATTTFRYDALGRLVETVYADGTSQKKEYDVYNNIVNEIDGRGFATKKTYNFRGQVTSIEHPDGGKEQFSYRSDGKLASMIDRNQAKKVYTHDIFGHVLSEEVYSSRGDLLKSISSNYSPFVMLSTTDGEGVETSFIYDFAGKKLNSKTGSRKTSFFYDTLGRLTKTVTGDVAHIEERDLLNRVIETRKEDLDGHILEKENYEYDELGNKTCVLTSKGKTKTAYNARGEVISIKDPFGNLTSFSYERSNGQLIKTVIKPKNVQKIQVFDSRKREIESRVQNSKQEVLQKSLRFYDPNGNLVLNKDYVYEGSVLSKVRENAWTFDTCNRTILVDEAGLKKTVQAYDFAGRLKTVIKPDGKALNYAYDDLGRLTRYCGDDFEYHYEYDKCDRVISVIDTVSNTSTTRFYDIFGNVTQEKLANSLVMNYGFDNFGHKIFMNLPDQSLISYTYLGDNLHRVSRKNLTHTYSERDLEGNITRCEMGAGLGVMEWEYDALSRVKKCSSDYYKAFFPKDAYDEVGNLCRYEFVDALGKVEELFSHDDLDQLQSENDHAYDFDSLHNRIAKDEKKYEINALCQIGDFSYDANGNLLNCEGCACSYDSLGRLVEVKKGDEVIRYKYDPFGRCLSKSFTNPVQKFSSEQLFIYDGENEIGSTDTQGGILELRVLGEGVGQNLGAEMGAAVFIELRNKTFIPIHDFRGNLVSLIDPSSKKPLETYRFTAFGEAVNDTQKLSPWRFASKRCDKETNFINFGKRHYLPSLGRWLTPDPQGFPAGPNLYAYVSNNPLIHFDYYGLIESHRNRGIFNDIYNAFSRKHFHFFDNHPTRPKHCSHYIPHYEDKFAIKSRTFDLGLDTSPNRGYGFVNGIQNSSDEAIKAATYLSALAGNVNFDINYSASNSFSKDIYTAIALFIGKLTPDAYNLRSTWFNFFQKNPEGYYFQQGHSRGTAVIRNALHHTPPSIRSRIYVLAIAPSTYIPLHLAGRVSHLISSRDLIPYLDLPGRLHSRATTTKLTPHKDAPWFDHSLMSPTYERSIKYNVDEFLKWSDGQ